ncbi:MAG: lytic transglycosylase domain-containing protein, partial [Desulfobacteraceae bacterium]
AYLSEAARMLHRERKAKRGALDALHQINEKNSLEKSKQARTLMQNALAFGRKKEWLYAKYRKELRRKRADDRLKPFLAVEYGFKYFAQLMRTQKGDISLALASYNAGPRRVRQFKGIPPFEETVRFRNQVLHFYREYLKRAKAGP